jgi:hypothetical protein
VRTTTYGSGFGSIVRLSFRSVYSPNLLADNELRNCGLGNYRPAQICARGVHDMAVRGRPVEGSRLAARLGRFAWSIIVPSFLLLRSPAGSRFVTSK